MGSGWGEPESCNARALVLRIENSAPGSCVDLTWGVRES